MTMKFAAPILMAIGSLCWSMVTTKPRSTRPFPAKRWRRLRQIAATEQGHIRRFAELLEERASLSRQTDAPTGLFVCPRWHDCWQGSVTM